MLSAIHQEIRTTDGLLRALRSQHAQTEKPVQVTGVGVPPVVQSSVSAGDSNCRTDGHR
ncbi:hypothetical protein V5G28_005710 [Scytonema sp. PRP1]